MQPKAAREESREEPRKRQRTVTYVPEVGVLPHRGQNPQRGLCGPSSQRQSWSEPNRPRSAPSATARRISIVASAAGAINRLTQQRLNVKFFGDVTALWREIAAFIQDSANACEKGATPWILAAASLGLGAVGAAVAATVLSARPVATGLQGSFWIARVVSLRLLAFIFLCAFAAAFVQNKALIGDRGILPARNLLDRADANVEAGLRKQGARGDPVLRALGRAELLPTLLWFARDRGRLDRWLDGLALAGAGLAGLALVRGGASAWQVLALWVIYHSINSVGQRWYSFGWESQLLEATALTVLAAPAGLLGCGAPGAAFASGAAPPLVAVWAFRWMAFRIMLGAGLIKARGAACWLDLTAMCHHLETQPIPNPLSRRFHNLPRPAHLYSTACNHVIELLAPWLLLLPWMPAQVAFGALHVLFQAMLILSGNLSFLNWLTIIPALWCFDDAFWIGLLPQREALSLATAVKAAQAGSGGQTALFAGIGIARSVCAVAALLWLSVPVYRNLLGARGGGRQRMNSTFERSIELPPRLCRLLPPYTSRPARFDLKALRLLNTYGAFGSVNKERVEIVFEGSLDQGGMAEWRPFVFKAAVDDPMKRPRWLAPYHLRLDWCRWIASCRGRRAQGLEERWVISFVARLMLGDPGVRALLARDPFEGGPCPRRIRAGLYVYSFAPAPRSSAEPYWLREYIGEYLPPLRLCDLTPRLSEWGLLPEGVEAGQGRARPPTGFAWGAQ